MVRLTADRSLARLLLAALPLLAPATAAQTMKLVNPATSGIPGDDVRLVSFAPDGMLWVGARWIFWGYGGFGWYDRDADLWTTWSTNDGTFPAAFVNDIAWAADGTAWIATDIGLVRWKDGVIKTWTTANSPLLHNTIMSLDLAADGSVWLNNSNVQTTVAAIWHFDGAAGWTSYKVGAQLPWSPPWNALNDVLVDHAGHVWVTNQVLNGVAEFDGASWTLHGAAVDRFDQIEEDAANNIWLRAGVGGFNAFYRFNHTAFKSIPIPTTPTEIAIDDDGAVFLGDWNGTIRKSTNFGDSFTVWATGLNHVFNIAPAPDSTDVWIGTPNAVGQFNGAGQLVRDFNTFNTGMPDFFVDRFDVDTDGNMWLATGEGGLSRFDGLQWRNWGAHNLGSEPWPFAGNEPMGGFYMDAAGTGWMGGNGIARWVPETGEFTGFWNWQNNPGMGVDMFEEFAEDMHGDLFAASQYGNVFRFNGSLWVKAPVQPYVPSGLPGMQADSQGNLWLAAWFDLWTWDGATWTTIVLPNPNYFFDLGGINDLSIGPDDVLWFGTNDGLVRWDGVDFIRFTTANSPLPAKQVKGVDVRDDGTLGLSCSTFGSVTPFPNGVCVVDGDPADPQSWAIWKYGSSPLPHYQLGNCAWDAEGSLWVSAVSEGVAVLLQPALPLASNKPTLSSTVVGEVLLSLDAGPQNAGRTYVMFGSVTGTSPGVPLPGGATLPLNWDAFSELALSLVNTPVFAGFAGTLDGAGRATATLDTLGPVPVALGVTLHFAYGLHGPWNFASNPVAVRFSP